jgi:hypothetical protein
MSCSSGCGCDCLVHPAPLAIGAGLPSLPRQIAGFAEFRRALLGAIPRLAQRYPVLVDWRARDRQDFGIMLLECWAYACDVVAMYDKVIADELYVRTAQRPVSLRRLTGLLGYVPRPAIAATVRLGFLAAGRRPIALPAGTAVRSGGFGAEPPQVYETLTDAVVHPTLNRLQVARPRSSTLSGTVSTLLFEPASLRIRDGAFLYIEAGASAAGMFSRVARRVDRITGPDGARYAQVTLDRPITVPAPIALSEVRVLTPTRRAPLWQRAVLSGDAPAYVEGWPGLAVLLDASYPDIADKSMVLIALGEDVRHFLVGDRLEVDERLTAASSVTVSGSTIAIPAVTARASWLFLWGDPNAQSPSPTSNWSDTDAPDLTVHFGLVPAGRLTRSAAVALEPTDPIVLADLAVPVAGAPTPPPERFLFRDAEDLGVELGGSIAFASRLLTPDSGTSAPAPLALPVVVHANVVAASRGETVRNEVLGLGDQSQANQRFTLLKQPLTFVPSPAAANPAGIKSTLTVRVDGVRWDEVPTFYGLAPTAPVYIVRQDDAGASAVIFGDGVFGARLPTGGVVTASYRFGAGAKSPPANSIGQLARPVKDLVGVASPVAPAGGQDAEAPKQLRTQAPRSALLLGRAVSMIDMETLAATTPGVRAARAEWRWEGSRQRAVIRIWYIGGAGLEPIVSQRIRAMTVPETPITVGPATALPATLAMDLETDPRRVAADVCTAVRSALLDPDTGLLAPENVGIGTALFRSRLFESCLAVTGAQAVRALLWNGAPFDPYGVLPGAGTYFDFEQGTLDVTGSAATNG